MRSALASLPLLLACVVALPAPARACSCSNTPGPRATPALPWFSADAFPTNGLFTSSLEWHDATGRRFALVPDAALSASLGFDVRRPPSAPTEGTTLFPDDDCPSTGTCRHALVFGAPDTTPPSVADLVDVTVVLSDEAPATGSSCQVDALVLEVAGTDDRTPMEELATVVFLGTTEAEAMSITAPAMGLAYDRGAPGRTLVSTVVLGAAEGHRRDGGPLRSVGTFCFAAALMDTAGNVGARSVPRCLDTTDVADPAATVVPYDPPCSGAFCAASPGRASSHGLLGVLGLALTALLVRRRR